MYGEGHEEKRQVATVLIATQATLLEFAIYR